MHRQSWDTCYLREKTYVQNIALSQSFFLSAVPRKEDEILTYKWRSTTLWDAFCLTEIKSYRSFSTVKRSWLAKLQCKEKENMWSRWRRGVPQSSVCCCDGYLSHWASVPVAVLAFWKGKSLCSSFVTECWARCLFLFLEEMPFCSEAANCRGVLLCEASI